MQDLIESMRVDGQVVRIPAALRSRIECCSSPLAALRAAALTDEAPSEVFQLTDSAARTESTECSQLVLRMNMSRTQYFSTSMIMSKINARGALQVDGCAGGHAPQALSVAKLAPGPREKFASVPFRGDRLFCGPSRTGAGADDGTGAGAGAGGWMLLCGGDVVWGPVLPECAGVAGGAGVGVVVGGAGDGLRT